MKKEVRVIVCIAVAVLMCFALAACGGGGQTATPAPEPAAPSDNSPAPAPDVDASGDDTVYPMEVAVTLGLEVSPNWNRILKEELEAKSNGRFKVNINWAGSLLAIPEIPESMKAGIAEFTNLPTPNYPDKLPLNTRIAQMPFMGMQDPVESAEIWMQLYDEFPEMQQEMENWNMKVLGATTLGMYGIHTNSNSKEIRKPSDLKGLKIVPYSTVLNPAFEKNGAVVSYIPPNEIATSLSTNAQDGYVNNWAFQGWFGLTDYVKQHVEFGDYGMFQEFNLLIVNKSWFDALPADMQQMLNESIRTDKGYADMWKDTLDLVNNQKELAKAKDDLMFTLTPEELELWKTEILPAQQMVLDEINGIRGDDAATRIYERCKEIIAQKYGA